MRFGLPVLSILLMLPAMLPGGAGSAGERHAATFTVRDEDLAAPLKLVGYGDMRFTAPSETSATNPVVRRALVAKIAAENPAAIFIDGDLTWHGVEADYEAFRDETGPWREGHLRVYPALGNHEFAQCAEEQCLDRWWQAFPELRGRRWYSVALGSKVLGIALDSDVSLLPGSAQRTWLENEIAALGRKVRFVLIVMHHPPVADEQSGRQADHNPRTNERSLAEYLSTVAPRSAARFAVCAGHIHNYERFTEGGVVYLVSGGGGATPYEVERARADQYQRGEFPNYHYVRFDIRRDRVVGEMIRLADPAAPAPREWQTADRFEISLRP